jgi:hypothetical protein
VARRTEWEQQVLPTSLLHRWLDHSRTFATAVDNVSSSAMAGAMRKRRGVVPGMVDNVIVHRRKRTGCMVIAIKQDGANQVSIITSTAEREAAIEFAKAKAMRPKIVGEALRVISADPEVAKAVFDVLEVESLLEGKVKITLLPEQSDLLAQITAIAGGSG